VRKTYRYKDIIYPVADETDVNFTVEFISNGNMGQTIINVPGPIDPEIDNADTKFIGKGKNLRNDTTICVSDISNPVSQETEIKILYKINNNIICEHQNLKSEEIRPLIILFINFPVK
jgi:hypothetical protein